MPSEKVLDFPVDCNTLTEMCIRDRDWTDQIKDCSK